MAKINIQPYLDNAAFMAAYEAKREIDNTKKELAAALAILGKTNADETAITGAKAKHEEFQNISKAYGILLEDGFGATWHVEYAITEHLERS